jgi:hypothetical protein
MQSQANDMTGYIEGAPPGRVSLRYNLSCFHFSPDFTMR